MKLNKHLLPLALLLGLAAAAKSQTTDWGTSVGLAPLTYTSSGSAGGPVLTWTIGWFTDGFTPTASNYADWAANYHVVDTNYEIDYGGLFAVSGHKSDVGEEAYGKQAYIFAFNDLGLIGTSAGEALLFAEVGYVFPDIPNQGTFDIADNPWDSIDDVFNVVWGRLDRNMEGAGGVITGGGSFGVTFPDSIASTWEAQSATWEVVPEPSTALLGALASLAFLRRKRSA